MTGIVACGMWACGGLGKNFGALIPVGPLAVRTEATFGIIQVLVVWWCGKWLGVGLLVQAAMVSCALEVVVETMSTWAVRRRKKAGELELQEELLRATRRW